jgi:hypothetical protein
MLRVSTTVTIALGDLFLTVHSISRDLVDLPSLIVSDNVTLPIFSSGLPEADLSMMGTTKSSANATETCNSKSAKHAKLRIFMFIPDVPRAGFDSQW